MKTKCPCWVFAGVLGCAVLCSQSRASGLVVHEWGTFTSVQGSDGKPLSWTPLSASHLPRFVYNWRAPGGGRENCPWLGEEGKGSISALARLETPVIYFYTDTPKQVDISVRFPKGLITEWYPQASSVGPSAKNGVPTNESRIEWSHVQLLPGSQEAPPTDSSGSHYFTARDTDAAMLRVPQLNAKGSEYEKFLFYRGVANFVAPLRISMKSDTDVSLVNEGSAAISDLFVLRVTGSRAQFIAVDHLASHEQRTIALGDANNGAGLEATSVQLHETMRRSLEQKGLYPKEAEAMVNTWGDSWFKEAGVRVLYILPGAWTESVLPMKPNPKPSELVRVMVGRSEVFSPGKEKRLSHELTQAQTGSKEASRRLEEEVRALGRFGPPALDRVQAILRSEQQGSQATGVASVR